MIGYLEGLWEENETDDLGGYLSDMEFAADGCPMDPAAWEDWLDAVEYVKRGVEGAMNQPSANQQHLTTEEAYRAMLNYLEGLCERTNSDQLAGFLRGMRLTADGQPADPMVWKDWLDVVDQAKKGAIDPFLRWA